MKTKSRKTDRGKNDEPSPKEFIGCKSSDLNARHGRPLVPALRCAAHNVLRNLSAEKIVQCYQHDVQPPSPGNTRRERESKRERVCARGEKKKEGGSCTRRHT